MHVRVATLEDRVKWDAFVDTKDGSFFHYFDWKYIYETVGHQYIPLILENGASQIIGILPVVKKQGFLYSTLESLPEGASGGFVLGNDLTDIEKSKALTILLRYVDMNYSKSCSTFTLKENLSLMDESKNGLAEVLINNRFRLNENKSQLPCTYVLELKQPFEENIWHGLWSRNKRNHIRKAIKKGVVVIPDEDFNYIDDFTDMLSYTFKRLGSTPLPKDEVIKRLTVFKKKTKLFVALLESRPIAAILCYYTPSTCYISKIPSYAGAYKYHASKLVQCVAIEDACKGGYNFVEFGTTGTLSLAAWKEHFKGTKVPMRIYEKKYSSIGTIIEKIASSVTYVWNNKRYVWNNRRKLFGKLIHRWLNG